MLLARSGRGIALRYIALHCIPICSVSSLSVPFRSILFHSAPFQSASLRSIPFHSVPVPQVWYPAPFEFRFLTHEMKERVRSRLDLEVSGDVAHQDLDHYNNCKVTDICVCGCAFESDERVYHFLIDERENLHDEMTLKLELATVDKVMPMRGRRDRTSPSNRAHDRIERAIDRIARSSVLVKSMLCRIRTPPLGTANRK